MNEQQVRTASEAAAEIAREQGLAVDDITILSNSTKVMVRLRPSEVVARVAPADDHCAPFELDLADRLVRTGCPVVAPDPRLESRVYERAAVVITFWTYHPPVLVVPIPPADYADALQRLHLGMQGVSTSTPHVLDRVTSAAQLVAEHGDGPRLTSADRRLLSETLDQAREAVARPEHDQLLHGEPHPGNLLATDQGVLFVDLETCCRGPVEFDLAHAPVEVAQHYPDHNQQLLDECRRLMLAMIISWRLDPNDQLPDGDRLIAEWLDQLRTLVRS